MTNTKSLTTSNNKIYISTLLGTLLENFDFLLFLYLAPIILPHFLPINDNFTSIIVSYIILIITSIIRPIGAYLLGKFSDQYGAQKSLIIAITLMSLSCIIIATTPSFNQIGYWSICILIIARSMQLFSAGGEINIAAHLLLDKCHVNSLGLHSALMGVSAVMGLICSNFISGLVKDNILSWQQAYYLGSFIGFINLLLRTRQNDNITITKTKLAATTYQSLISAIFISGLTLASFYFVIIFVPTFIPNLNKEIILAKNYLTLTCYAIGLIISSLYYDNYQIAKYSRTVTLLAIISLVIFFCILSNFISLIYYAHLALTICFAFLAGPIHAILKLIFKDSNCRYLALSYCLGALLFGSSTPFICANLYKFSGSYYYLLLWFLPLLIINNRLLCRKYS